MGAIESSGLWNRRVFTTKYTKYTKDTKEEKRTEPRW